MDAKAHLIAVVLVPIALVLALTSTVVSSPTAPSQNATVEQSSKMTFTVQQDVYVDEGHPDTNQDGSSYVWVGRTDTGDEQRALVEFDVSALPDDVEVVSATLELAQGRLSAQAIDAPRQTYRIWTDAVLGPWDETTVTWSTQPRAANKGDPPSDVEWTTGWHRWDVTNIVETWVSSPAANHGILLRGDGVTEGGRQFFALPSDDAARLTVSYQRCEAVTRVDILGPFTATTSSAVDLTAEVRPAAATEPVAYRWAPEPRSGQGTEDARYAWDEAGQHTIVVTATNCGGTVTDTHVVGVNAVRLLDVPADIHRRAAQHLEETRGTEAAPGWALAELGSLVHPLYRPDIEGVAYWEFPVVAHGMARGYIVLSAGEHDYPIAHWASSGQPLTWELEQEAADSGEVAVRFYKLDTLAYAAENENGQRVATIGAQPFKISGMDPAWLDDPPDITEAQWTPNLALPDDSNADQITGTFVISGPTPPPSLTFSGWDSWQAMKAGFSESYGILAEVTRRNASDLWTAESALATYGYPLFKGEIYAVPLLWQGPTVSLYGDGAENVETNVVTRSGLPPLLTIEALDSEPGEAIRLRATIEYDNGATERVAFVIIEPYRTHLPLVARRFEPRMPAVAAAESIGTQDVARIEAGPWSYHYAGTDADQCWYRQIPGGESPNISNCASGCGATGLAMLFGWIDNQAEPGENNDYWLGRWGLYRREPQGFDLVAPKTWGDSRVKDMVWEIRNEIDTWCAKNWDPTGLSGENGPTNPWDMGGVRNYVRGRSGIAYKNWYNVLGISEDRLMEKARDSIRTDDPEKATPALIGTGWLEHYPLAYGFRSRRHTYCVVPGWGWTCWKEYEREFLVNQGGAQGHGEWVSADIWYAGRAIPLKPEHNDVGVYRPSTREWYFDHDHSGNTDEKLHHFGGWDKLPIVGDFDRDNVLDDIGVYDPADRSWHFSADHTGTISEYIEAWGRWDSRPVAIDFDRDGFVDDIGLYWGSEGKWLFSTDRDPVYIWLDVLVGQPGDLPVTGDFDRDGFADDIAYYRPSTGMWIYTGGEGNSGPWGLPGDLPVAGDFDDDGYLDDVGVYRPSTGMWYYDYSHDGDTDATSGPWGLPGDQPIAGDFETGP